MERFTEKIIDTSYCIPDLQSIEEQTYYEDPECRKAFTLYIGKAVDKLAEYEDLDEQCVKENSFGLKILMHKWKEFIEDIQDLYEYRKLEKQGKLLKFPCAVGDTVYQHMVVGVDKDKRKAIYEIFKAKVFKFSLDSYTLCFWTETLDEKKYQNEVSLSAFGKTVFYTKEEAEVTLKKLKKRGGSVDDR